MKALVTYFSASGVTAGLAKRLSDAVQAPVYEIKPAVPYTEADLDWRNKQSRSTVEMQDKDCRGYGRAGGRSGSNLCRLSRLVVSGTFHC